MPSLVSHKLSIIKYVVSKKIFFSFSVLTVSFGLGLNLDSNLFGLGLDSDSNLFGLGLDSDSNLFGLGLVLDSTKVDLQPYVDYAGDVSPSLFIKSKFVPRTFSLDSCVLDMLRF